MVTEFSRLNTTTPKRKYPVFGKLYKLILDKNLALKIYGDCRPHNLEIAQLQKGLIVLLGQRELIEEGVGFGVPVTVFSDKTYFSRTAKLSITEKGPITTIVKQFYMDTVSRKVWKDRVFVDNSLYRRFSGFLSDIYRDYSASRRGIFPFIKLRNKLGIKTRFIKVKPRGTITMTYKIKRNSVEIEADFSEINNGNCAKVLLLNEQGSTFFRRFFDSNGVSLTDEKIGAWDRVTADWACLSDLDLTLGFRLKSLPHSKLLRGREYIKGRLSWAGMAYELSPSLGFFKYEVTLLRGGCKNG